MRHLYEFSKDGYRYRASALETSHAGLDVWIEGDGLFPASEWAAADPETDQEAFEAAARELLNVVRILDGWEAFGRELAGVIEDTISNGGPKRLCQIQRLLDRQIEEEEVMP